MKLYPWLLVMIGFTLGYTQEELPAVEPADIAAFERLVALTFTAAERELMAADMAENRAGYQALRSVPLDNATAPVLTFRPSPPAALTQQAQQAIPWHYPTVRLPDDRADLAFYSIAELGALLRTQQITSVELTRFFLDRMQTYAPRLHCVINYTEARAMAAAERADREIAAGHWRGPLHGIPYGAKDLFAVPGVPTTWGAKPFADQVLDETATVIQKLDAAGAVLIAKLSLGALAWGDVWFGGTTRNPWNLSQGSSGSSAGSASAVAAGLVPFALGTETLGSIVSPSHRCGVTGLRPTFGRVSRHGAMALSWSMDKVGPIVRSSDDAARVFDAIRGSDGHDPTVRDLPFNYTGAVDWSALRIGYVASAFEGDHRGAAADRAVLDTLRQLGAQLVPIELPDLPVGAMRIILSAEAAAAFDQLTRAGSDDQLVRQIRRAWPNVFRASRSIPAVEYINANRLRAVLMARMTRLLADIDVYVCPTYRGNNLLITNLTGHPSVVLPNGFGEDGQQPKSITFMGRLYGEASLLAVTGAYQQATDFHMRRPTAYLSEPSAEADSEQ